jgi:cell division protein ZapD
MREHTIIFQLPTHFLPKIALRLEYLFSTMKQACEEDHPIIHNSALQNLTEILQLIQKPELKSRFLKELMRIEHITNKSNDIISPDLYARLYTQIQVLTQLVGRFGEGLQQDPLIQSTRASQSASINDCDIQPPQLVMWLQSAPETRKANLRLWLTALSPLHNTVQVYLNILRYSAKFHQIDLFNGFYQCQLPSKSYCHLILLRMNNEIGIFPQMQLGHHGLSLRLFEINTNKEVRDCSAQFEIAICQI